jgi:hypothetical protein
MPREHIIIFCNLLDGGPSRNRLLFRPSESLRGGTLGTHLCQ